MGEVVGKFASVKRAGAALALALFVSPAAAQVQQHIATCNDEKNTYTLDQRIASCTTVIESGAYTGTNLAITYMNRGNVYDDKGDTTAPSPSTIGQSSSMRKMPGPTSTALWHMPTRRTMTTPSPTTTNRSRSSRPMPLVMRTAAWRGRKRATYKKLWRISKRLWSSTLPVKLASKAWRASRKHWDNRRS